MQLSNSFNLEIDSLMLNSPIASNWLASTVTSSILWSRRARVSKFKSDFHAPPQLFDEKALRNEFSRRINGDLPSPPRSPSLLPLPLRLLGQNPVLLLLLNGIFDDMDLPFAKLRLLPKGGHGGHNGMRSVIDRLKGSRDFPRLRIGIGRPPGRMDPASYVLRPFNREERAEIQPPDLLPHSQHRPHAHRHQQPPILVSWGSSYLLVPTYSLVLISKLCVLLGSAAISLGFQQ
nr:Peptidyl-tRNA hydrolase [Ipomoea batatas]